MQAHLDQEKGLRGGDWQLWMWWFEEAGG